MPAHFRKSLVWWGVLLACVAFHLWLASHLSGLPRRDVSREMQVALPRFIQVAMAGGDRYLAANLADFRALVASTDKMNADSYRVQAIVQSDAAWLNPAHEDNYYLAAAILPWNGEIEAGDYVLRKAIDGRPFDWSPVFYFAFNRMYFHHDHVDAANWLRVGAQRASDVDDRLLLENMAARWYERGYDTRTAILVVSAMAKGARDRQFQKYLWMRVDRLKALLALEVSTTEYRSRYQRLPDSIDDLISAGLIGQPPKDPFGFGFAFKDGMPILLNAPTKGSK